MQKEGTLILVVGLPGSGKGTLISYAKKHFPSIVFPISWTTRPKRPGEREGEVYHFVAEEEFSRAVSAGEFLEWVSIDGGHRYGTLRREILLPLSEGKTLLREVEVAGAKKLRALLPEVDIVYIFIDGGPWEDLSKRMLERAPMSEEELEERHKRYERELSFKSEAKYVIENVYGKLGEVEQEFSDIISRIERES
ncbi:MAG: guanylate kinase [Patescibacteria group bacterium]|nr:guanylate kinase [Patescibacteria group bacterium]